MKEEKNKKNNFENILKREIRMFFSQEFAHKDLLIAWILADTIKVIGLCFVWVASAKITQSVDQGYIVSYYIMLLLISKFTQDVTPENGVRQILNGKFSNSLLKPISYLTEYLGSNIGSNLFRLLVVIPAFVLGIFIASKLNMWIIDFNPYLIFLTVGAVILGFFINFMLGNIFTLLAFYNKNMEGMRIFYNNIAAFLSGEYAPLVVFPFTILFVLKVLPFRYTLSFPIEIMLGRLTNYDIAWGFIVGLAWLIILYCSYIFLSKKAIKKYAAEGI